MKKFYTITPDFTKAQEVKFKAARELICREAAKAHNRYMGITEESFMEIIIDTICNKEFSRMIESYCNKILQNPEQAYYDDWATYFDW